MENIAAKIEFEINDGSTMEQIVVLSISNEKELHSKVESYGKELLALNEHYLKYNFVIGSITKDIQALPENSVIWQSYRE